MTRKYFVQLVPALVLALGILASALVATLAAGSPWIVGAGVLLLAVSILGADVLDSWVRRQPLVPSLVALLSAAALLGACGIVAVRDPGLVAMMIPVLGAGSAAILFKGQSDECYKRAH